MATVAYLSRSLTSFLEIWGTIVWLFVSAYFLVHLFIACYGWWVINQGDAKFAWYWPLLSSLVSVFVGFVTIGILALPLAGIFVSISLPIPVLVAVIIAGALLVFYFILNFNGLYIF